MNFRRQQSFSKLQILESSMFQSCIGAGKNSWLLWLSMISSILRNVFWVPRGIPRVLIGRSILHKNKCFYTNVSDAAFYLIDYNFLWKDALQPFKRQFHRMVKHTQTIRREIVDELFECVWPLCGIGA